MREIVPDNWNTYCDGKEGTVYTFTIMYVYVSHDHQPSYH